MYSHVELLGVQAQYLVGNGIGCGEQSGSDIKVKDYLCMLRYIVPDTQKRVDIYEVTRIVIPKLVRTGSWIHLHRITSITVYRKAEHSTSTQESLLAD